MVSLSNLHQDNLVTKWGEYYTHDKDSSDLISKG